MSAYRFEAARVRTRVVFVMGVAASLAIGAVSAGGVAHADCVDAVVRHHRVNADLLRSIAYYEWGATRSISQ